VGLLAREIEACGVTTVGLALVRDVAVVAYAPRMLYLRWPFGHALGEPGHVHQQRTVLRDMLSMARAAPYPGLVVDLPYRWRRETFAPVEDWTTESDAFARALSTALAADGERASQVSPAEALAFGADLPLPGRRHARRAGGASSDAP
jgi:D-proline reductase (dithiol) PrdB